MPQVSSSDMEQGASSMLDNPHASASTAGLVNSPSIHIRHLYVYNFSPEPSPLQKSAFQFRSPAASSGPFCRICHEGDAKEDLISPCRCTGSLGLVHLTCMERWLSTRCNTSDKCEICNYNFATIRSPKSLVEWLRSDEQQHRQCIAGDVTCFVLLTVLASVGSFLCVEGAKRQIIFGNSLEAGCLMALATFFVTIYCIWNGFTFRYHLRNFYKWRSQNQNVKIIRVQKVSTTNDQGSSESVTIPVFEPNAAQDSTSVSVDSQYPDLHPGLSGRRMF
ncbi:E3 ubiquitin-protein ligase MARCHF3-like [Uloborus diversus]|uniref:E3 ubiquitin-protein ligase MARCHF3-like n=1 Tax=Uloborus diversus TaxID=327109 RepID=UPI00240A491A|nr:E3 ubiquitin-protein ligase MARCHF3-like [Uloborus diversus]